MSDTPTQVSNPAPETLTADEWAEIVAVIHDATFRITTITTRALVRSLTAELGGAQADAPDAPGQ